MQRFLVRALYGGMALAVAACGSASRRVDEGPDPRREVVVTVKNENFYDATVYACRGTQQDRLGVVSSSGTRTFTFRWVTSDLRFLIDFIAAGRYLSHNLHVETGDELQLVIPFDMHRGRGNARCVS